MREGMGRLIEVGDEVVYSSSTWKVPVHGTVMAIRDRKAYVHFADGDWQHDQLCDPAKLILIAPGSLEYGRDREEEPEGPAR